MFEQYKTELRDFYISRKNEGQLSADLESMERRRLRAECLKVLAKKSDKAEIEIIKNFFDPKDKFENYIEGIEKFDLDKFRPIVSFLVRGSSLRDEEPVKLLALLLGFKSYQKWRLENSELADNTYIHGPEITKAPDLEEQEVITTPEEELGHGDAIEEDEPDDEGTLIAPPIDLPPAKLKSQVQKKILYVAVVLIFVLTIGIVLKLDYFDSAVVQPKPSQKCMYWNGEQYEAVDCSPINDGIVKVPLNLNLLNNFRKINWPDTLTKKSIGKVWYAKTFGDYEFFTANGVHPGDTLKRLRPLSAYILSNHLSYYRFLLMVIGWFVAALTIIIIFLLIYRKLIINS